jgi:hypothetical protein
VIPPGGHFTFLALGTSCSIIQTTAHTRHMHAVFSLGGIKNTINSTSLFLTGRIKVYDVKMQLKMSSFLREKV